MKKLILLLFLTLTFLLHAQDTRHLDRDKSSPLSKENSIVDRAGGTHDASNIGLFFENRGKLYPRRVTQGPSGEFPINSTKNYIYRVAPYVGIPENVVQSRHTQNEEWEAVPGYHNSALSQIAFSDNPKTWHPDNGWPVKDAAGNPVFKSDQDSYAVFTDSNNTRPFLGVEVHQVGHAYGVSFAKDMIFFKYMLINKGKNDLDSLYFSMYCDFDIGNVSGGVPEYADDLLDFDKENNFIYFFDDGVSPEWPDQKTGFMGLTFLSTPEINGSEAGITDMHYFLYFDDQGFDYDTLQYGIMSSSPTLYNSPIGSKYFHLGNNTSLNYDDPETIPQTGLDLVAQVSSGPYSMSIGDTLIFYTAIIAGETLESLYESLNNAYRIYELDFEISKPPDTPSLTGVEGNLKATLFWDDVAESTRDNFSGEYDFDGYRLYRSIDNGVNWDLLEDYNVASSNGLQYSYVDTTVVNGFEYWYSITAYDRGDSVVPSLESPKGNSPDAKNLVSIVPRSDAAGYNPVASGDVSYVGIGSSNYLINVDPVDNDSLRGNEYKIGFNFVARKDFGNLETEIELIIKDSTKTEFTGYAFAFIDARNYELINLNTDEVIEPTPRRYISGREYNLNDGLSVKLTDADTATVDQRPQEGDQISIRFGVNTVRNNVDTVIATRRIEVSQTQATTDGVIFSLEKPDLIRQISRVSGTDFFEIDLGVDNEDEISDTTYLVSVNGSGSGSGGAFVEILVRDEALNQIAKFDTVFNNDRIYFGGLEARINFDPQSPPSTGNVYSITTIVPIPPNMLDAYQFTIEGSSIDRERAASEINNIKVVPNPYVVSSLFEPEFGELRREPLRQIQFINLPNECTIYIFTIDADLVKTIYHSSFSGTAIWDLRSEGGREIAPGVYIYVVKSGSLEFKSRFAVIK